MGRLAVTDTEPGGVTLATLSQGYSAPEPSWAMTPRSSGASSSTTSYGTGQEWARSCDGQPRSRYRSRSKAISAPWCSTSWLTHHTMSTNGSSASLPCG